jgi:hypothetical protein
VIRPGDLLCDFNVMPQPPQLARTLRLIGGAQAHVDSNTDVLELTPAMEAGDYKWASRCRILRRWQSRERSRARPSLVAPTTRRASAVFLMEGAHGEACVQ